MVSAVRDPQSSARTQIACNQSNLPWSENSSTKPLTCEQGHTGKTVSCRGLKLCRYTKFHVALLWMQAHVYVYVYVNAHYVCQLEEKGREQEVRLEKVG